MLFLFLVASLLEWVFIFWLKREPFPRLWISPLSQQVYGQKQDLSAFGRLPPDFLEFLLQESSIQSQSTNFDKALQLMDAVRDAFPFHIYDLADFDSTPGYLDERKLLQLWRKKKDLKVNCGTYSHLFLRLCRHFEIPARIIVISDRKFRNNHVLSEIWDETSSSWILVDLLYNAYFTNEGEKLSVAKLQNFVMLKRTVEVRKGKAQLDWYCTPARLFEFFQQGLVDYVLCLSPRFSPVSRFLHPAYLLDTHGQERWWIKQKILQLAVLILPALFLLFALWVSRQAG